LYDAGFRSRGDLVSAKIEELANIPTIGKEIAKKIKKQLVEGGGDNENLLPAADRQTSLKDFK
jgi:ERCC4-type nuclease